jgi:group I intron endonuclease
MKDSGLYQIVHIASGKLYVGSSERLEHRLRRHREDLRYGTHHSIKLQRAWDKYGPAAFVFVVMFHCEKKHLLFYEQRAIDTYDAVNNGYNVCPIAGNCAGVKHTPETCLKRSATMRKRPPPSSETRAKLSAASSKQRHSRESIEKMAVSKRGVKQPASLVAVRAASNTGLTRTLEQRIYMSSKNSQHALTDDQVREIRSFLAAGLTTTKIATIYGVHRSTISSIKRNKNYKYVL